MVKIVSDNYLYAKVAKYIEDKSKLSDESIPGLTDVVGDEDRAKEIVDAAKASMGRKLIFILLVILILSSMSLRFLFLIFLHDKICPQLI